jgi:hypothetical protein
VTDWPSAVERGGQPVGVAQQSLLSAIISSRSGDETILMADETIFRFGADIRKQRMVIS